MRGAQDSKTHLRQRLLSGRANDGLGLQRPPKQSRIDRIDPKSGLEGYVSKASGDRNLLGHWLNYADKG